jgi:DNA sulfur modification protein DndE
MLPNRMNLDKNTEESLRRLKQQTGITPNVLARIAFFRSIESGYEPEVKDLKHDGSLVLDKITWLGDTSSTTELLLKMKYPKVDSKTLMSIWANHVKDGIASLRNHKSLQSLLSSLVTV